MTNQNCDLRNGSDTILRSRKKLDLFKIAGFLLLVFLLSFLFLKWKGPNFGRELDMPTVYVKDRAIYVENNGSSPVKLVEQIYRDTEEENLIENVNLDSLIHITKDGSRIYFFQNIYEKNGIYIGDLVYRDLKAYKYDKLPGIKVDSDVACESFTLAPNGKIMLYLKGYNGETGNLYLNKLNSKNKLSYCATNRFRFSNDSSKIIYKTYERDSNVFWLVDIKKCTQEKLGDDIDEIVHVDKDFNIIYYSKISSSEELSEYDLYMRREDKTVEKVLSNISGIHSILDSGEILYEKAYLDVVPFGEIVKCPREKKLNRSTTRSQCMFIEFSEDYYAKLDKDAEKLCPVEEDVRLRRFMVAETYEENPIKIVKRNLYKVNRDGSQDEVLQGVNEVIEANLEKERILYSKFQGVAEKVHIDELRLGQDVNDYFYRNYEVKDLMLLNKGEKTLINKFASKVYNVVVNDKFTDFYVVYQGNKAEEEDYELYQYSIGDEIIEKKIDEKVDLVELLEEDSNLIAYYRYECDEDLCSDLYLYSEGRKVKVGDNIVDYNYNKNTETLTFMENIDMKTGLGDLVLVKDFDKVHINDNVFSYFYKKDRDFIYYFRVNGEHKNSMDLWKFDLRENSKNVPVDFGVESLLYY